MNANSNEKVVDRYHFFLKDKLGEGSFGVVYKGKDTLSKQTVAIKMLLKKQINADPYLRRGLMSEIKIMKKLKGANVVQLLDVLETTNNYYIVQEYCDSGDLAGYLKKQGIVPEEEAKKILTDILTGFLELLRNGIIHRDLKPANILIDHGTFKLADFGFAKCMQSFSRDFLQSNVGTPLYMAPQILMNQRYKSKSDIWSLGFIYYECIFGHCPWMANSIPELLQNIKTKPLRLGHLPVSPQSQDLLQRCLTINEDDRISWDDIYRHQLFGTAFASHLEEAKKLEFKANFIINDLRNRVASSKLDMLELFQKHSLSTNQILTFKDLEQLLQEIDPQIAREEVEFVFNMFDEDHSNSIDFNEFKRWLQKNQVRMSLADRPAEVDCNTPELKPRANSSKSKASQILTQLQQRVKEKDISLVNLFKQLDKDQNFVLDPEEFGVLISKIEPTAEKSDVEELFSMFDRNRNKAIDFQEFKVAIQTSFQTTKPSQFQLQ